MRSTSDRRPRWASCNRTSWPSWRACNPIRCSSASRRRLKLVFPLYNEEVHLLGRRGITDFDDLADRRVAIGREGSGTYLTARLLFKVSEVHPKEMVLIDTDEALAELKAGRIDAMFYVAGYPVKLFSEGVTEADGLALIPITNKSITEFYPRAEIPAGTYAVQPNPVDTVAVKAMLISFDFRRRDCDLSAGSPRRFRPTWLADQERTPEVEISRSRLLPSRGGSSTTASAGSWGKEIEPRPGRRPRATIRSWMRSGTC